DCAATTAPVHSTTTERDAEGLFVTKVTNALGQSTTRKVHPGLGVEYASWDANQLLTTTQYDGFGRPRLTTRPDSTTESVHYTANGALGWSINVARSDGSQSITYYDREGQEVRRAVLGFDSRFSYVDTIHDGFGRVATVTRPYYSDKTAYFAARY